MESDIPMSDADEKRQLVARALDILRRSPASMDLIDAMDFPEQLDSTFGHVLPDLQLALRDPNEDVQLFALKAIAKIGGDINSIMPAIALAAAARSQHVRRLAVSLLGCASGDALPIARVALGMVVKDMWAHIGVRLAAFRSLVKISNGLSSTIRYLLRG